MLSRFVRITAAVLSGVTASLLVGATTTQAAQEGPVVVYGESHLANVERVPYRDLNLAATDDRRTLNHRVAKAVRNVCEFDSATMLERNYRSCSAGAWNDARPQIDQAIANAGQLALNGQSSAASGVITISGRLR